MNARLSLPKPLLIGNAFIAVFLVCVFSWTITLLFLIADKQEPWQMGDWLLNYSSGFVRRGLSGELFLALATVTGLEIKHVFAIVLTLLYVTFFAALFELLYAKRTPLWFLLLLFSPATLLFAVNDTHAVARKELLYLTMLAVYVLLLGDKRVKATGWFIVLSGVAAASATLMHELFVFYVPYFLAAAWIAGGYRWNQAMWIGVAGAVGSGLATAALLVAGLDLNAELICSTLVAVGLSPSVCEGLLTWPAATPLEAVKLTAHVAARDSYASTYGVCLLLGMLPIVLLMWQERHRRPELVNAWTLVVLLSFAFSAPLFATAIDWGRFLHIHFMSLMILSTLLLERVGSVKPGTNAKQPSAAPAFAFARAPVHVAVSIFVLVYVVGWGMPHCCWPRPDGLVGKTLLRLQARDSADPMQRP